MAKQGTAVRFSTLCLLLFVLLFSGCVGLSERTYPGPWHEAYRPIDDVEAARFVDHALALAITEFGEPAIPVNRVLLRRSRLLPEARRYVMREDFSLTACIDRTNGVFVIAIGVDPDDDHFYALLGHECAHLIQPLLTDWYMEGAATVFSEQACAALEKEWGSWKRRFSRSKREPYALSYRMMCDLQAAFPEEYPSIVRHAAPRADADGWLRIDIDGWIASLPDVRRPQARQIIAPYARSLGKSTSVQYGFTAPSVP